MCREVIIEAVERLDMGDPRCKGEVVTSCRHCVLPFDCQIITFALIGTAPASKGAYMQASMSRWPSSITLSSSSRPKTAVARNVYLTQEHRSELFSIFDGG